MLNRPLALVCWAIAGATTLLALSPVLLFLLVLWPASSEWRQSIDLGNGRTLRFWSIKEDRLEPGRPGVYYCVEQGSMTIVPTTYIDNDDGESYHFETAFADNGKLVCVYEVNRYQQNASYVLMYDHPSGESWPRLRDDESMSDSTVRATWRDRYRRISAANPHLSFPGVFEDNP